MVLVIEDEQALQDVLIEVLALAGISAICAGSGEEGVAHFASQRGQIKAVFLDLHLPGMGGYDTFRALRESNPTIPVVIMSGQPEYVAMAQFDSQEHLSYLEKPFTLDLLMATIDLLMTE